MHKNEFSMGNEGPIKACELVKSTLERITKRYEGKANVTGIPTGFHDFDILTTGLQTPSFIVLAGRHGMGKTAFMLSLMEHIGSEAKVPCAYFSLIESKETLMERMLSMITHIRGLDFRTGCLSQEDWSKLPDASKILYEAPVFIDDTPALNLGELKERVEILREKNNVKMVFVDDIFLLRKCFKEKGDMTFFANELKSMAHDLGVTIMGSCRISSAVDDREDHMPGVGDIAGGVLRNEDMVGGIMLQRLADMILLLHREEFYNPTDDNKGIATVAISKKRCGSLAIVSLKFVMECQKFTDLPRAEED